MSRSPFRLLGDVVARVDLAIAYPPSAFGGVALVDPRVLETLLDAALGARGDDVAGDVWLEGVARNLPFLGARSARPLASAAAVAVGAFDDDHDAGDRRRS